MYLVFHLSLACDEIKRKIKASVLITKGRVSKIKMNVMELKSNHRQMEWNFSSKINLKLLKVCTQLEGRFLPNYSKFYIYTPNLDKKSPLQGNFSLIKFSAQTKVMN